MSETKRNWTSVSSGDLIDLTRGKNEAGEVVDRVPSEKTFIEGYYTGRKLNQGNEGNSTIHSFLASNIGSKELEEEKNISMWGTGLLNDLLNDVKFGTFVRVKWLGKVKPTQGKKPYHKWEVLQDKSDVRHELVGEFVSMNQPAATVDKPAVEDGPTQVPTPPVASGASPSDDLPF